MTYDAALLIARKYLPYLLGRPIIEGSKFPVTDVVPTPMENEYQKAFQHCYIQTKNLQQSLLQCGYEGRNFEVHVMFSHPSLIFGGYQELYKFLTVNNIQTLY
jgi:hypothetical protein